MPVLQRPLLTLAASAVTLGFAVGSAGVAEARVGVGSSAGRAAAKPGVLAVKVMGLPKGTRPAGSVQGGGRVRRLRSSQVRIRKARPGHYVIRLERVTVAHAWRSVKRGARVLPAKKRVSVTVRAGKTAVARVRYGTIVNPGVRKAPSGPLSAGPDPASPTQVVYRNQPGLPKSGDLLMAAPSTRLPAGLIARVTGVSSTKGRRVLSVRSIPVSEALPEWAFEGSANLVPASDRARPTRASTGGLRTAKTSCKGALDLDYGARLDKFEIRRASAKIWRPQMSLTLAVRTTEWFGPKASLGGLACQWTLAELGPWRGAIVVFGLPIPVYATIPITAKADIGSLSAFKFNVASTSVLDLDLGHHNHFGFSQQGTNVWANGQVIWSGDSKLSVGLALQMGVGDPKAGNIHVDAGFDAAMEWKSGQGCDLSVDLGSLSARAKVGPLKLRTPAWTPVSRHLWHGCDSPGGGGGDTGGGGETGGGGGGDSDPGSGGLHAPEISSGFHHTCGLRTDGSAACWGYNAEGQASPPSGAFSQIDAGSYHTCGLHSDGTAVCWGLNDVGQASAPSGAFSQISAGSTHTCGLRTDGTAVCWGGNSYSQTSAPGGAFSQITAGGAHTCGLRSDGTAVCWGLNDVGQASAPSGEFSGISAGGAHTCGLRTDGTAVCWGGFNGSQASPPSGAFSRISAGLWYTCGLRGDGSAICWGGNVDGQATPPGGTFSEISAGADHTCGVRSDGIVVCWGDNDFGQSSPPNG